MISLDDLNKLDDKKFEKLVKTSLLLVIWKGVTPFSAGKDGAREAIYSGKAEYPSRNEIWEGNWIFQVKFSDISLGIDKARDQIKYTINSELSKLNDYGYITNSKVDNYIYITNVPFSGEAEKGLHDYIAKKKDTYKVKNFNYWDGEKILALINSHPQIRETFFPTSGINTIDNKTIEDLRKYFVKPMQYDALKASLISNRILNIVGQAHVGKTSMSLFIAADICEEMQLSNILFVPLIDELHKIPEVTNSVIVFDDLYGDINYDSIGKKTKIINSLHKENYVIITSRDYIYKEAEKKTETFDIRGSTLKITQEGAFTNQDLELILKNHLDLKLISAKEIKVAYRYLINNSTFIINQLRYPHNIQLFTSLIDSQTTTKPILYKKIAQAKKIEEVVQSWILPQGELNKQILLALSIGKIHDLELLTIICQSHWGNNRNDIEKCLIENSRIISLKDESIQFIHPSFKTAIINLFNITEKKLVEELIINLISHSHYNQKRIISRNLANSIISNLNSEQLIQLLLNNNLTRNYQEVCWLSLLKLNRDSAISLIVEMREDSKIYSRNFSPLVSTKDFLKSKEISEIISHLLSRRHESKAIEQLIVHFSFGIKPKIRQIIEQLDYNINSRDLKLKIRLLGVIGSENPDSVLFELESELFNKFKSTRSIVYSAINMLSNKSNDEITSLLERALNRETNKDNILKINRGIKHRKNILK